VARDASETKALLLGEAERLFALRGVHQATTREITEAAGQRNTSALTYHFGSRSGLLYEILRRHGTPLDAHRAELVAEPIGAQSTRALVGALVLPLAGRLETASGRYYLRILPQLTDQFPIWRVEDDLSPPHLRRILAELEGRATDDVAIGRQRVIAAITLMTSTMAERARLVDEGAPLDLDPDRFVANLTDMIVAVLETPIGALLVPTAATAGAVAGS
jgi:AcrR family transcriptional regulator